MHILIATDGTLDVDRATNMVGRLYEAGDSVTVLTVIPFPKTFLHTYAEISGAENLASLADEVGSGQLGLASGSLVAERMAAQRHQPVDPQQPRRDYFAVLAGRRCDALVDRLAEAGIAADLHWSSTDDQTARAILAEVDVLEADVLVLGSHGHGRFGPLGSTVNRVIRHAPVDVCVVKQPGD